MLVAALPLGQRGAQSLADRVAHLLQAVEVVQGRFDGGQPEFDPTFIISHRMGLEEAPKGYDIFKHKQDECAKVVLTP